VLNHQNIRKPPGKSYSNPNPHPNSNPYGGLTEIPASDATSLQCASYLSTQASLQSGGKLSSPGFPHPLTSPPHHLSRSNVLPDPRYKSVGLHRVGSVGY